MFLRGVRTTCNSAPLGMPDATSVASSGRTSVPHSSLREWVSASCSSAEPCRRCLSSSAVPFSERRKRPSSAPERRLTATSSSAASGAPTFTLVSAAAAPATSGPLEPDSSSAAISASGSIPASTAAGASAVGSLLSPSPARAGAPASTGSSEAAIASAICDRSRRERGRRRRPPAHSRLPEPACGRKRVDTSKDTTMCPKRPCIESLTLRYPARVRLQLAST
mmetsp:Transcript_116896/g.342311  ORF Transcript_116896/g.342311 Transcript_116896/m.342311 type:complete len:223 (-) Transcript_116896:7-675(-)